MTECTHCGNNIEGEPFEDGDGDDICGNCWKETQCFFCSICRDHKWEGEDEERNQYIVIAHKDEPEPGIYRVTGRPFYRSNYFNIWYEEDKLQQVGDIDEEKLDIDAGVVGGFVCFSCIKNIHDIEGIRMMNRGNCLWCGRPGVTLMDGRFCGLCQGDLPEELAPET